MKIIDFKSIKNISELQDVIRYTDIDMNLFLSVINGNIDFVDNCSTALISVNFPKANTTYGFVHGLGRLPQGFLESGKSANMVIFNSNTTQNNINQIFLQSSAIGTGKVLVF